MSAEPAVKSLKQTVVGSRPRRDRVKSRFRWQAIFPRRLKLFGRRRLLDLCQLLDSISDRIQHRILKTTIPRERAQANLELSLEKMDQDLLGMYIRWNGHH